MSTCKCGNKFIQRKQTQILCKKCKNKEWRLKNRQKLNKYNVLLYKSNPKRRQKLHDLQKLYINTLKGRLSYLVGQAKTKSKPKPGTAASKTWTKSGLGCNIDTDFLLHLWDSQCGRCVISGLKMNYNSRNLRSVSLDQIDSSIGYTTDNVQLVCRWANMAKGNATNIEMLQIIKEIKKRD